MEAAEATNSVEDVNEAANAVETPTQSQPHVALGVSLELILYIVLLAFTFTLRLPDLGTIPLDDVEAHEALSAYRAVAPNAPGTPLIARSPLMFDVNAVTMALIGSENATTRMPTAILGTLIVLLPLGFRRWLGPSRALILAGLLALSPVLLIASRTMSGSVWSAALALIGILLIGKFFETRRAPYAVIATIALLMLLLMSESAGFLTFLSLIIGVVLALLVGDSQERRFREALSETIRSWPWARALPIAAGVIGLVGTVFLLYPPGLNAIGESLDQGLNGFVFRPAGYPVAFPLITSLLYEPLLWIFGIVGIYFVLTRSDEEPGFPS